MIRTGWSKLMGKDNSATGRENAGIGIAAAQWLLTQNPIMVAADNCCVEVRPSEPGHSLPVHAMMIIQHGIYLLENLELESSRRLARPNLPSSCSRSRSRAPRVQRSRRSRCGEL